MGSRDLTHVEGEETESQSSFPACHGSPMPEEILWGTASLWWGQELLRAGTVVRSCRGVTP